MIHFLIGILSSTHLCKNQCITYWTTTLILHAFFESRESYTILNHAEISTMFNISRRVEQLSDCLNLLNQRTDLFHLISSSGYAFQECCDLMRFCIPLISSDPLIRSLVTCRMLQLIRPVIQFVYKEFVTLRSNQCSAALITELRIPVVIPVRCWLSSYFIEIIKRHGALKCISILWWAALARTYD